MAEFRVLAAHIDHAYLDVPARRWYKLLLANHQEYAFEIPPVWYDAHLAAHRLLSGEPVHKEDKPTTEDHELLVGCFLSERLWEVICENENLLDRMTRPSPETIELYKQKVLGRFP